MTREDYELIATALKKHIDENTWPDSVMRTALEELVESLAEPLIPTNKSFDKLKFLKSCGISS
jgi:hypothetical protein